MFQTSNHLIIDQFVLLDSLLVLILILFSVTSILVLDLSKIISLHQSILLFSWHKNDNDSCRGHYFFWFHIWLFIPKSFEN